MVKTMLKICSLLLACLLYLEAYARIDDFITHRAPLLGPYTYETMLVTHDELGRRGKPNGHYEKWTLNSYGFRGPEFELNKPENTVRIVAFGASETFGLYEPPGMEWPSQLRDELDRLYPNRKIEVINTAIAGLSLMSSLDYFKGRVLKLNPDIVLYYQDFIPFFYSPHDLTGNRNDTGDQPDWPPTNNIFSIQNVRIIPKLKQAIKDRGPRILVDGYKRRKVDRMYEMLKAGEKNLTVGQANYDFYKKTLSEFTGFLRDQGITVILSEHVNRIVLGRDEENKGALVTLWKYNPKISAKTLRENYPIFNRAMMKVAEETGALFLEQSSLHFDPERFITPDGVHLTNEGASELAANFLSVLAPILNEPG
jgi:lysophospholipase L1-like esterase